MPRSKRSFARVTLSSELEQTRGIVFGPDGPERLLPNVTWRFTSADEQWRVSLATDFVAIETTAYKSRSDLLGRLEEVVRTLESHIAPQTVDRLGVRYIDRMTGASIDSIDKLVRPEMLGVAGTAAGKLAMSISEALFDIPDQSAQMRARWGLLPDGGTFDPAAIEPINERSWILDLDVFSEGSRPFERDSRPTFRGSFLRRKKLLVLPMGRHRRVSQALWGEGVSTLAVPYSPVSPPLATSGDGVLRHVRDFLVFFGSGCATQSTTATTSTVISLDLLSSAQTNSGLVFDSPVAAQAAAIAELRQRSGLTWEQLARLFGVARRSVHFWASGKAMNSSNEEVLNQLLRAVRYIDRGESGPTRSALMSAQTDGAIPFDLLVEGHFDDVMRRLRPG